MYLNITTKKNQSPIMNNAMNKNNERDAASMRHAPPTAAACCARW